MLFPYILCYDYFCFYFPSVFQKLRTCMTVDCRLLRKGLKDKAFTSLI